ncbi:MAG: class I mannose-6-phosphate isomerase [bacterium]
MDDPIKVLSTRVYRVYKGGYLLDKFRGEKKPKDTNYPEDWICSTVEALQPYGISKESISKIEPIEGRNDIESLLSLYPQDILGEKHINIYGRKFNILVKLLDSAIRLPIQCHPDKSFSRRYFNSNFGKAEAWFILETRENPYILLGFKEKIPKAKLKGLIDRNASEELASLMNRIEVRPYDMYFIAPRLPHAIGEGVFMVETQEPTDFTISIERRCGDVVSTDEKCTLNLGWDIALDAFDYTQYSIEDIKERFGMKRESILSSPTGNIYRIDGGAYMETCFNLISLEEVKDVSFSFGTFASMVVINGRGYIVKDKRNYPIRHGETYIIPASFRDCRFVGEEPLDILLSLPPEI